MSLMTLADVEKIGDSIPSADPHNSATFNSYTTAICGCGMQLDYWRGSGSNKRVRIIVKHNMYCSENKTHGLREVDSIYRS